MRPTMTDAEIARAVRAGFVRAGANPERYAELVGDIVADVAEALRAFAPVSAAPQAAEPRPVKPRQMRSVTDAA